jgi:hypothetical protein
MEAGSDKGLGQVDEMLPGVSAVRDRGGVFFISAVNG